MDDLIKRVEGELAREMNQQYNHLDNDESDIKVNKFEFLNLHSASFRIVSNFLFRILFVCR